MKVRYVLLSLTILIVLLTAISYVRGISGTVVDAETGQPVEGAVIHVEWTTTKGVPGQSYTQDYKISETSTNSEGKFRIFGVLNPLANLPIIVIYKRRYVAWRNDYIFPDYKRRNDVQRTNKYFVELERFRPTYSHSRHLSFLKSGGLTISSAQLSLALSWEASLANKEERLLRKKIEKTEAAQDQDKLWQEIIQELYLKKGEVE